MWFSLILKPKIDVDIAWTRLEEIGLSPLFSSEGEDVCEIVVDAKAVPDLDFIEDIRPYEGSQDTDWYAQWEAHGHHFRDGFVHLYLGEKEIKMAPGPGFGDLSHPTTLLTLDLLEDYVGDRYVLDIGSGSGVLSLAAAVLGAKYVFGVDIDTAAVAHAQSNALLNHLDDQITFSLPEDFLEPLEANQWVIVINMIWSEQQLAWPQWLQKANHAEAIIISGVLVSERESYLTFVRKWEWEVIGECQQGEWLAFVMKKMR